VQHFPELDIRLRCGESLVDPLDVLRDRLVQQDPLSYVAIVLQFLLHLLKNLGHGRFGIREIASFALRDGFVEHVFQFVPSSLAVLAPFLLRQAQ
jgi:hypothetical protein